MSPPKNKIKIKPLVLDGNGHFEDSYIETLIDIELRRTRLILKRNYQEQFNNAGQTEKLLNEMTFAEASLAFLDSAKSPSVSL